MVVYPCNGAMNLIEADVVKALKAGTSDLAHAVVRYQKFLLPAHEHVFAIAAILVVEVGRLLGLLAHRTPGWKARPSFHVVFVGGSPIFVACLEGVFRADDLSFKACSKGRVLRRKPCTKSVELGVARSAMTKPTINLEISANGGLGHIHRLDIHFDAIPRGI